MIRNVQPQFKYTETRDWYNCKIIEFRSRNLITPQKMKTITSHENSCFILIGVKYSLHLDIEEAYKSENRELS